MKNLLRDIVSQLLITSAISSLACTDEDQSVSNNCDNVQLQNGPVTTTITNLAKEYAEKASSDQWTHFLDILLGSLISLLRRIYAIHTVIVQAIASANSLPDIPGSYNSCDLPTDVISEENVWHDNNFAEFSDDERKSYTMLEHRETTENYSIRSTPPINAVASGPQIIIPGEQLRALKVTSQDVLVNVCDQVVERISKILSLRSKESARKLISTKELHDLAGFADILTEETIYMTGRISSGFQISLQAQAMIYIESFHEDKKAKLSDILVNENWKKICFTQSNKSQQGRSSNSGLGQTCPVQQLVQENESKFLKVPSLHKVFFPEEVKCVEKAEHLNSIPNKDETKPSEASEIPKAETINGVITNGTFSPRLAQQLENILDEESRSFESGENIAHSVAKSPLTVNGLPYPPEEITKSSEISAESESDSDLSVMSLQQNAGKRNLSSEKKIDLYKARSLSLIHI